MEGGPLKTLNPMALDFGRRETKQCDAINVAIAKINQAYAHHVCDQAIALQYKDAKQKNRLPEVIGRWMREGADPRWEQQPIDGLIEWEPKALGSWLKALNDAQVLVDRMLKSNWAELQSDWFCDPTLLQIQALKTTLIGWQSAVYRAFATKWVLLQDAMVENPQSMIKPTNALMQQLYQTAHQSHDPAICVLMEQHSNSIGRCVYDHYGQGAIIPPSLSFLSASDVSFSWGYWFGWLLRGRRFRYRLTHRLSGLLQLFSCEKRLTQALEQAQEDFDHVLGCWQQWGQMLAQERAWVATQIGRLWRFGNGFSRHVAAKWLDDLNKRHEKMLAALQARCMQKTHPHVPWSQRLFRVQHSVFFKSILSASNAMQDAFYRMHAQDLSQAWLGLNHEAFVLLEQHVHAGSKERHHDPLGQAVLTLSHYALGQSVSDTAFNKAFACLEKSALAEHLGDEFFLHGRQALTQKRRWYAGLGALDLMRAQKGVAEVAMVPLSALDGNDQMVQNNPKALLFRACAGWRAWLLDKRGDEELLALKRFYQRIMLHTYWSEAWAYITMHWCQSMMQSSVESRKWQGKWQIIATHFDGFGKHACSYEWFATWLDTLCDGKWSPFKQTILDAWGSKKLCQRLRFKGLVQWLELEEGAVVTHGLGDLWPHDVALEDLLGFEGVANMLQQLLGHVEATGWLTLHHLSLLKRLVRDKTVVGHAQWQAIAAKRAMWQTLSCDFVHPEQLLAVLRSDEKGNVEKPFQSCMRLLDLGGEQAKAAQDPVFVSAMVMHWARRLKKRMAQQVKDCMLDGILGRMVLSRVVMLMGWLLTSRHRAYFEDMQGLYRVLRQGRSLMWQLRDWGDGLLVRLNDLSLPQANAWLNPDIYALLCHGVVDETLKAQWFDALGVALKQHLVPKVRGVVQALHNVLNGCATPLDHHALQKACVPPKVAQTIASESLVQFEQTYRNYLDAMASPERDKKRGVSLSPPRFDQKKRSPLKDHVARCLKMHAIENDSAIISNYVSSDLKHVLKMVH